MTLVVSQEIRDDIAAGGPVVALETTIVSHIPAKECRTTVTVGQKFVHACPAIATEPWLGIQPAQYRRSISNRPVTALPIRAREYTFQPTKQHVRATWQQDLLVGRALSKS